MAIYRPTLLGEGFISPGIGTWTDDAGFPANNYKDGNFSSYHRFTGFIPSGTTGTGAIYVHDASAWNLVPNDSELLVVKARVFVNTAYLSPTSTERGGSFILRLAPDAFPAPPHNAEYGIFWGPASNDVVSVDMTIGPYYRSSFSGANASQFARLSAHFSDKSIAAGTFSVEIFIYEIWLEDSSGVDGDIFSVML